MCAFGKAIAELAGVCAMWNIAPAFFDVEDYFTHSLL